MPTTPRDRLLARWAALKTERSGWEGDWREIAELMLPRAGRFTTTERNRGGRRGRRIYDSTGLRALRVLAAGMMAGMSSPARPWFRLTTAIPELDESSAVKVWCADVLRLMQMVFAKSNTYRALHSVYEELGAFGTGASISAENRETIVWHHPLTVGEYALATDANGVVNTIYRELEVTVAQAVAEFGRSACSSAVRNLFDRGTLEAAVPIFHAIEPRADREVGRRDARNMPWRSVYLEPGADHGQFLRESGFPRFPALAPRWVVSGADVYGYGPGSDALGDVRQLQHQQLRKAQAIDYQTKPPLQVPTAMKNSEVNTLPGGISYYDASSPTAGIRSAWEVNLDLGHLLEDIRDVRQRIDATFYADLFLMLASSYHGRMTATEVAERHEEKLLMLGPVLERLTNELLAPLIDITFDQMLAMGIVPPPPNELQGIELNVEFVGILAQAQRAVSTNSIDRFMGSIGAVAQMKPDVLDKIDADRWADAYADMLGVDPEIIVPGAQVARIRQQRAQAQAAAEQAAQIQQAADTAETLARARTDSQSALTDVMDMFAGY